MDNISEKIKNRLNFYKEFQNQENCLLSLSDLSKISLQNRDKAMKVKNKFIFSLLQKNDNGKLFEEVIEDEEIFQLNEYKTPDFLITSKQANDFLEAMNKEIVRELLPVLKTEDSSDKMKDFFYFYYGCEILLFQLMYFYNEILKYSSKDLFFKKQKIYKDFYIYDLGTPAEHVRCNLQTIIKNREAKATQTDIIKKYAFYIHACMSGYNEISHLTNFTSFMTVDEEFEDFKNFVTFFYINNNEMNHTIYHKVAKAFIDNISKETKQRIYQNKEKEFYFKTLFKIYFSCNGAMYENNVLQLVNFIEKTNKEQLDKIIEETAYNPRKIFNYLFKEDVFKTINYIFENTILTIDKTYDLFTFVNWCNQNKKKNLLNIFVTLFEKENNYNNNIMNILNLSFIKNVDLNSASIKEVEALLNKNWDDFNNIINVGEKLNNKVILKELLFIYDLNPFKKKVYELLNLPMDEKINKVAAIPEIDLEETREYIQSFVRVLETKKYPEMKKALSGLDFVLPEHVVCYFANYEELSRFVNRNIIKTGADIVFCHKNINKLPENITANEYQNYKKYYIYNDEEFSKFLDFTKLSEQFIFKYIDNIFEFKSKGLIKICNNMFADSHYTFTQRKNLLLIVKSVLAKKFHELKYDSEDFAKEIGCIITPEEKEQWIKNVTYSNKNISVIETDDFEKVLRLGEKPVQTCQHHSFGSYRESLLSNFDTNKKLVTVYENNIYIARAIERFTQYNESYSSTLNSSTLHFKDVEEEADIVVENTNITPNKKCLMLELPYISSNNKTAVLNAIVNYAINKAKSMNIDIIFNNKYLSYAEMQDIAKKHNYEYMLNNLAVYISNSKNGNQYLDTVQGSVSYNSEGKFLQSSQVHLFKITKNL